MLLECGESQTPFQSHAITVVDSLVWQMFDDGCIMERITWGA